MILNREKIDNITSNTKDSFLLEIEKHMNGKIRKYGTQHFKALYHNLKCISVDAFVKFVENRSIFIDDKSTIQLINTYHERIRTHRSKSFLFL